VPVEFQVDRHAVGGGRVLAIAPGELRSAVSEDEPEIFAPTEAALADNAWTFPKASVSVVELELA